MKNRICPVLILLSVVFGIVTAFAGFSGLSVGDVAKDFALKDAAGRYVTLGSFQKQSRFVVLELLSAYCTSCKHASPEISQIARTYRDRGVSVVAVALANDQSDVREIQKEWNSNFPVLADPEKTVYYLYGIHRVPQFYIIDNRGIIRFRSGSTDLKKLEKTLVGLLQKSYQAPSAGYAASDFTLPDLHGDSISVAFGNRDHSTLLGFFSGYTAADLNQARALSEAYSRYGSRGMRVFAVISGHFEGNLDNFVADASISYTILKDTSGKVFKSFAVNRTPVTIIVNENGRISERHHEHRFDQLIALLEQPAPPATRSLSTDAAMAYLRKLMPDAQDIQPVLLENRNIYVGTDQSGGKSYARFVEKDILCDVCTDVHFAYSLFEDGTYKNIILINPIERYGTPIDSSAFLAQFIGKSYHQPFVAGLNADAISGATKTCKKIIEGLNETEFIFAKYVQDPSFDTDFRQQLCFTAQAEIELALHLYTREHAAQTDRIDIRDLASYCPNNTLPRCPSHGTYTITIFNGIPRVMCTVHGLDPQSSMIH